MKTYVGMLIDFDLRANSIVFLLDKECNCATGLVPLDDYKVSLPYVESKMELYEMYELVLTSYDEVKNLYTCEFANKDIFKDMKEDKRSSEKYSKYERYNRAYDKTLREGNKPYNKRTNEKPKLNVNSSSPMISVNRSEDDENDKSAPLTTNLASLINNAMQDK